MKKLLLPIVAVTMIFSSCGKDDFNDDFEFNIVGTKWQGKSSVGGSINLVPVKFEFLADGKLKGSYEPKNWDGTYNFNTKTNKGIILENGELEMDFEVYAKGDSLKFEIEKDDWVKMAKIK